MNTQAKLIDLRDTWRQVNSELTLARRAKAKGHPVTDEQIAEFEQQAAGLHADLVETKRAITAAAVPEIPGDVAALSDEALAKKIAAAVRKVSDLRDGLRPLIAERARRQLVISARVKLEKLTPEERAALQGIQPEGIDSGEQFGRI